MRAVGHQYLCNMNVLTTGFDAPHIDCVALIRATEGQDLGAIVQGALILSETAVACLRAGLCVLPAIRAEHVHFDCRSTASLPNNDNEGSVAKTGTPPIDPRVVLSGASALCSESAPSSSEASAGRAGRATARDAVIVYAINSSSCAKAP